MGTGLGFLAHRRQLYRLGAVTSAKSGNVYENRPLTGHLRCRVRYRSRPITISATFATSASRCLRERIVPYAAKRHLHQSNGERDQHHLQQQRRLQLRARHQRGKSTFQSADSTTETRTADECRCFRRRKIRWHDESARQHAGRRCSDKINKPAQGDRTTNSENQEWHKRKSKRAGLGWTHAAGNPRRKLNTHADNGCLHRLRKAKAKESPANKPTRQWRLRLWVRRQAWKHLRQRARNTVGRARAESRRATPHDPAKVTTPQHGMPRRAWRHPRRK